MRLHLLLLLLFVYLGTARAFELFTEKVTNNVYALVGKIGPRSYENHALNNTMGFVITDNGVVLVSSGASPSGARLIEKAIADITPEPVRWVVNIGAQDHHWLGNSYFKAKGAEIIALSRTVASQKYYVDEHLHRLQRVIKEQADEVKAMYAIKPITGNKKKLQFSNLKGELIWPGAGHFADDAILWLPKQKIVFAGDLVFQDRMLDLQTFTSIVERKKAFDTMVALKPRYVIPGHGYSGDLVKAKRDTGDYLEYLITHVRAAQKDWKEIDDTVDKLEHAPAFKHLKFYDDWHRHNINLAFLQLEATQ